MNKDHQTNKYTHAKQSQLHEIANLDGPENPKSSQKNQTNPEKPGQLEEHENLGNLKNFENPEPRPKSSTTINFPTPTSKPKCPPSPEPKIPSCELQRSLESFENL